ncbi:hypothetical protein CC1G_14274 [Coprinopsis cinerea okayama7|uniref:Uncharacterized protein n=1 Tax=Coprinopsis cinerea (strain Okayama-7 / 130 / ATCC MYA-4618 / FGSC 9003) TaxID=240176 RepID=D6RLR6_COPC7|nr:hypothetical protein CC1G_14274 [Coprinopsis cinerea okayama7\|eukprot:XP_002911743.1 hypothetical protein CC1G_14274 [Coprinopsis cinerea okayama7\
MSKPARTAYAGSRRKLVVALDVGTTFSGISYCILDPGQVSEIKAVTRFPAAENSETTSEASKIPTVLYYDSRGNVKAVGAETNQDGIFETAMDEGWMKVEWFKLHIRPKSETSSAVKNRLPPLPRGKTVVQVLSDFLRYLFKCAKSFIQDTHVNGRDLWNSLESTIHYVITHPNGWEGYQQSQIRDAAVQAGFIPDTTAGHDRVSFVTEGEASLHFAIDNGLSAIGKGEGVIIVDAGGGTVDISAYNKTSAPQERATFEETSIPQCHFFGSVFVSIYARQFLEEYLAESPFFDDLDHIIRCFDKATKVRFSSDKQPQYIRFGSTRDNDDSCSIRFGQLKLEGSKVAEFFEPSVKCIIEALRAQIRSAQNVKHVVLVGGFSASNWLWEKVSESLKPLGVEVFRPQNYVNKAVSDGSVAFYLDQMVNVRIARYTYGQEINGFYDAKDPEHRAREHTTYISMANVKRVPKVFSVCVSKNTRVHVDTELRQDNFSYLFDSDRAESDRPTIYSTLLRYTGDDVNPRWTDVEPEKYDTLCSFEVDVSHLPRVLVPKQNGQPGTYWKVDYSIILSFGTQELRVQIAWTEANGIEKRSPVKIVYEPNDV